MISSISFAPFTNFSKLLYFVKPKVRVLTGNLVPILLSSASEAITFLLIIIIIIIGNLFGIILKSFFYFFVLVIGVRLELIWWIFGVGFVAFIDIVCLEADVFGSEWEERQLGGFLAVADVNGPELFVGCDCCPTRPVRVAKSSNGITTRCSLFLAHVVEELSAAVGTDRPTSFQTKLFEA